MTDEEMAEEYVNNQGKDNILDFGENHIDVSLIKREAFLAGLKAGRPKWHKVADGDLPKGNDSFGKTSIHRKIYLKDRHGNLYTGNYYPKDESHREDCFAVEFLDWGFQGAQFCAKGQISEWCEIPQYTEE